jgi:hypothetical protein
MQSTHSCIVGGQKFELEALYCYGMQFLEDYLLAAIVARDFINIA